MDLSEVIFTDLRFCINNQFLVGSHTEGVVSVINVAEGTATIVDEPFGQVDSIWTIQVIPNRADGEPANLLMASSTRSSSGT